MKPKPNVDRPATYTTGQVARMCDVSPRTASAWIDRGHLKGHRIPGSKFRRVHAADLDAFMARSGLAAGAPGTAPAAAPMPLTAEAFCARCDRFMTEVREIARALSGTSDEERTGR